MEGILFFHRELQGEELIDKLVEHGVVRFCKQAFECLVIGKKVLKNGGKRFEKGRARRLLGEANDGFRPMEKDLDAQKNPAHQ